MFSLHALMMLVLPTIWIVDAANGPGTNFLDLPPAVAAAASGDTIIVRAGSYTAFNVSGKALTIRGAGSSVTDVHTFTPPGSTYPDTTVDAVPAGSVFSISGLTLMGVITPAGVPLVVTSGLRVLGGSTRLVLTDSFVRGASSAFGGASGLVAGGGAEVRVSRSYLQGGGTGSFVIAGYGASGANVGDGCTLIADSCTFIGGSVLANGSGGSGLEVGAAIASLSRCNVFGVFGSNGTGTGGDGIRLAMGFVRVAGTSANVIQGGGGQFATPGYALSASQGGSIVVHGSLSILPAAPGAPLVSGPVFPGPPLPYLAMTGTSNPAGELVATQPVTTTFDGVIASAPFTCIVDLAPSFSTAFAPLALGELLVPASTPPVLAGTLDALGQLSVTLTPAVSVPALVGVPVYAQFGVYDAMAGQIRLSNGLIRVFH